MFGFSRKYSRSHSIFCHEESIWASKNRQKRPARLQDDGKVTLTSQQQETLPISPAAAEILRIVTYRSLSSAAWEASSSLEVAAERRSSVFSSFSSQSCRRLFKPWISSSYYKKKHANGKRNESISRISNQFPITSALDEITNKYLIPRWLISRRGRLTKELEKFN